MIRKAGGPQGLRVDPIFPVRDDDRRGGRKRELLATVHGMRKPLGLIRTRGACFVDARTEGVHMQPLGLDRWGSDVRGAYLACLDAIPAHVTGCEEGPLDPELDARLEALAVRFPRVIGRHFDNERSS